MRHASAAAVAFISGNPEYAQFTAVNWPWACDWSQFQSQLEADYMNKIFGVSPARRMVGAESIEVFDRLHADEPPDCPQCAVLLDLALELRTPAETETTTKTASNKEP